MGRLIDADALIEKCGDWIEEGTDYGFVGTVKHLLDKQPTVEERKTGHWIDKQRFKGDTTPLQICSCCGKAVEYYDAERYCTLCGADMREDGS